MSEKSKIFNPKVHAKKTQEIQSIEDAELGIVRYGELTSKEMINIINNYKEEIDQCNHFLLTWLQKGQSDLTINDIENLPARVYNRLLKVFRETVGDDKALGPMAKMVR